ncbi:hypothetical protein Q5M85_10235 [Paraclostridium bifermentans]|nr:hypothetical protein [Paraclostridium bifermentans]
MWISSSNGIMKYSLKDETIDMFKKIIGKIILLLVTLYYVFMKTVTELYG